MGHARPDDDDIAIRPATEHDYAAVELLFWKLHSLNAELDPRFALADGWERALGDHLARVQSGGSGLTLIAWHAARPVGLLMMSTHSDSRLFRHRYWAELVAIYVEDDIRGTSTADTLLAAGTEWAHDLGYERIQLYVTTTNERAKRFYQQRGFQPVQEIWRLELGETPLLPTDEPLDETKHDHGLLGAHSHHLLIDDDEE